jgi:hypothetical protein
LRHRGYRSRTLVGLSGKVVVRRARYQCTKTDRICFPLDEQLALPAGEVTAPLARRVTHLATHMSFAELQSSVALHYELRLCDSVLNRLLQRVGGVAAADEARRVADLAATPVGRDREERVSRRRVPSAPRRLYVSTDGVLYPSRNREENKGMRRILYQEMKCGAVFWQDAGGRWHKRVLNGREDAETFGLRLWALAVECGLLDAGEVIFISDGGAWCETVWRTHFRDARRILDWYHAAEHVWAAAWALHPDEAAARRWANRCLELLAEYSGIGLLRYLRRSRAARAGADERHSRAARAGADERRASPAALNELIGYIEPRVAYMDYYEYRAGDYVIGSGLMEATCKQVVGQRLKGSGRQWSEAGALAMATLISHRLNRDWDGFWATNPLRRAA